MATTSDAGRADLFEHYAIEPDSDIVKAFNNQIDADGTSWAAQTKKVKDVIAWCFTSYDGCRA